MLNEIIQLQIKMIQTIIQLPTLLLSWWLSLDVIWKIGTGLIAIWICIIVWSCYNSQSKEEQKQKPKPLSQIAEEVYEKEVQKIMKRENCTYEEATVKLNDYIERDVF